MSHSQFRPSPEPEMPDLRILPFDLLIEHEYNDVQRTEPLAKRLQEEGLLKNPPIVAPLIEADPRFVVLDGANRTMALSLLHYKHCLVQVVRYEPPPVTLSTWHHLVTDLAPEVFTDQIKSIEGLDFSATDLLRARAGLARRDFIAYVIRADNKVFAASVSLGGATIHAKNTFLNLLVNTYKEKAGLHRTPTKNIEEARRLYPKFTALVIFPHYEPAEVMALARDGELLPTGLTRHLIQGRALRINYPLAALKADLPLEEKNARLAEWLRRKITSKEVRYYAEATYLFDE